MTAQTQPAQPEALALAEQLASATVAFHIKSNGYALCKRSATELHRLHAENEQLRDHLQFVERWAVHHGTKPCVSAKEALGVIQHYPPIRSITDGYADGKRPDTFDPYARIAELEAAICTQHKENQRLRRNWCISYAGALAYTDDGEAQDNGDLPTINFLRDSVPEIEDKIRRRGAKALAGVKDSLTVATGVPTATTGADCVTTGAAPVAHGWIELTDEDRDRAFNTLPDMLDGFLKKWGWLHFAKAIEQICREKNSPQPPKEETLQWCNSCDEGVTTFCRGKTDNCPRGLPLLGREQP